MAQVHLTAQQCRAWDAPPRHLASPAARRPLISRAPLSPRMSRGTQNSAPIKTRGYRARKRPPSKIGPSTNGCSRGPMSAVGEADMASGRGGSGCDPLLTLAGLNFRSAASPDLTSPMRYAAPELAGVADAIRSIEAARFYYAARRRGISPRRRGYRVKGRDFLTLIGGAAVAWPLAAHAQQAAVPVVGFLSGRSLASDAHLVAAFRHGLNEVGYIDGRSAVIEFRWADGELDRLVALAADLVERRVAVIFAGDRSRRSCHDTALTR